MTANHPEGDKHVSTSADIAEVLGQRWSPRGFRRDLEISDGELVSMLTAARWSMSAGNSQPWRFIIGKRGSQTHATLLRLLAAGNQPWAQYASVLGIILVTTHNSDGTELRWREYDAGQAAALLTVQAEMLNISVHQMGGFDAAGVSTAFGLSDELMPLTAFAAGHFDPQAPLPEPYHSRERQPRVRLAVDELLIAGWQPPDTE